MGGRFGILAPLAIALASAAGAQNPTPSSGPAGCEFHVWPGDAMMSVYYGWLRGGIVNGAVEGRPGYPRVPPDPIDTATQIAILAEVQPQVLLAQPDHRLIVHDSALPSRAIRTTAGRLADSTSGCYAELIVDDVVLQQDVVNGSYLKILLHYRDFGADALPRRSFATWAQTHLTAFPPQQPALLDAAIAEIRQAYREDIAKFAQAALRPARRHH